jgi:hypothetical protein
LWMSCWSESAWETSKSRQSEKKTWNVTWKRCG